jgi:antitoxin Phd
MRTWQLQEARSRFSELVSEALVRGPQRVTRHGRSAVIIVSEEQWNEITQKVPSFGRMLAECPVDPDDLRTRRPARVFRSDIAG